MSPVRYELRFYIPENDIIHSYRRENLKSYIPECRFFPFVVKDVSLVLSCKVALLHIELTTGGRIFVGRMTDAQLVNISENCHGN
jgi:hypothetical protein